MSNFVVIFLSLVSGVLFRRSARFPAAAPQALNAFVIHLSLPALILVQVPVLIETSQVDRALWVPISMAWLVFGFSALLFTTLGKLRGWDRRTIGALILTAGLGNTSFVGFPLLEALIGPEAIQVGILTDQPGTFLALSTVGIAAAAIFAGAKLTLASIAHRIFIFPPFIALIIALLWSFMGGAGREQLAPVFEKIAATLVPLALFSVGLQLRVPLDVLSRNWRALSLGLAYKLVFAPLILSFLYLKLAGAAGLGVHVAILEAAMAPMITAAVVSADFGLDTEISNLMVGVGIPLSLATVPVWHFLLMNVFGTW